MGGVYVRNGRGCLPFSLTGLQFGSLPVPFSTRTMRLVGRLETVWADTPFMVSLT